jgi:hypothetical protein
MNNNLPEQAIRTITEIPATAVKTERDIRKQTLNAAAYCRVSTDFEDQLNSYNSQIDYYTGVINENPNWHMAGIFADEGLTGLTTKKRQEFNKMIRKAKTGRIDIIICKVTITKGHFSNLINHRLKVKICRLRYHLNILLSIDKIATH